MGEEGDGKKGTFPTASMDVYVCIDTWCICPLKAQASAWREVCLIFFLVRSLPNNGNNNYNNIPRFLVVN